MNLVYSLPPQIGNGHSCLRTITGTLSFTSLPFSGPLQSALFVNENIYLQKYPLGILYTKPCAKVEGDKS